MIFIRNAIGAVFLVFFLLVLLFFDCDGASLCIPPVSRIAIAVLILYVVFRAFSLRNVSFSEASTLGKIEIVIGSTLALIALAVLVARRILYGF